MAGVAGIEPAHQGVKVPCLTAWLHPNKRVVGEDGFEPPNPKELIYSQPRLATSLFTHVHFTYANLAHIRVGGCCRFRTYDPRLVRAMLSR